MKAVILAGGLGTRLQPYTTILPKPLIPVGHRPILEHVIERLIAGGVTRFEVCLGYLGELIQAYFTEAVQLPDGVELHWHRESEPLGTAGALRVVPGLDETFLVANGDVLADVDVTALVSHHRACGAKLTITMHRTDIALEVGILEMGSDGMLANYREKPQLSYDVSAGIYVYEPEVLELIPDGVFQFPDLVLALLSGGGRIATFALEGEVLHIGTEVQHAAAHEELERRG